MKFGRVAGIEEGFVNGMDAVEDGVIGLFRRRRKYHTKADNMTSTTRVANAEETAIVDTGTLEETRVTSGVDEGTMELCEVLEGELELVGVDGKDEGGEEVTTTGSVVYLP
jgi:uncharacterized cupin superfamily protein